jgi:hypothetical protein
MLTFPLILINQTLHNESVWGSRGINLTSLNTELYGDEWSASLPGRFTSQNRLPRCPLAGRLGGPQNCFERCAEEKNLLPLLRI